MKYSIILLLLVIHTLTNAMEETNHLDRLPIQLIAHIAASVYNPMQTLWKTQYVRETNYPKRFSESYLQELDKKKEDLYYQITHLSAVRVIKPLLLTHKRHAYSQELISCIISDIASIYNRRILTVIADGSFQTSTVAEWLKEYAKKERKIRQSLNAAFDRSYDDESRIKFLIAAGVNIHRTRTSDHSTILIRMAQSLKPWHRCMRICVHKEARTFFHYLFQKGAAKDINSQDDLRRTALHYIVKYDPFDCPTPTCFREFLAITHLFLDYGANIHIPDSHGITVAEHRDIKPITQIQIPSSVICNIL